MPTPMAKATQTRLPGGAVQPLRLPLRSQHSRSRVARTPIARASEQTDAPGGSPRQQPREAKSAQEGPSRDGAALPPREPPSRKAESTDWVATQLTRRFGIAGGLAWVGFLAVGTLGEQVKTRLEVAREESGTQDISDAAPVQLPSGAEYQDLRIGGGSKPQRGDLVVLDFRATVDGEVVEDTRKRGKPIVFPFRSRPFTGGVNAGVEEALAGMKAGGRRRVVVPPEAGFGGQPYAFRATRHAGAKEGVVPPNSTIEYELELVRVSIPPS